MSKDHTILVTLTAGAQTLGGLPASGDRPLLCDHPGEPLLVSGLEAELDLKWHQVPLEENCDTLIVTEFIVESWSRQHQ